MFDFAQQERKGKERADIPRRPAKGGATPLSSRLGKKAAERASEQEGRGGEERGRTCVRRCAARREAHEKPTKAAGGNRCSDG